MLKNNPFKTVLASVKANPKAALIAGGVGLTAAILSAVVIDAKSLKK